MVVHGIIHFTNLQFTEGWKSLLWGVPSIFKLSWLVNLTLVSRWFFSHDVRSVAIRDNLFLPRFPLLDICNQNIFFKENFNHTIWLFINFGDAILAFTINQLPGSNNASTTLLQPCSQGLFQDSRRTGFLLKILFSED